MTDMSEIDREIMEAKRRPKIEESPIITPQNSVFQQSTPTPSVEYARPQPIGQFGELMQTMMAIEQWKMQLLQNERAREHVMEERIRAELTERMTEGVVEEMDPGVKMALDVLVEAFKSSMTKPSTPGPIPVPFAGPQEPKDFIPAQPEIAQPAPNDEAPMPFDPDLIADKIYERFPQQVLDAQAGRITRHDAIAKIRAGGSSEEQAAEIYESIMNTDYSGTP